jgi:hypothetical protein
MRHFVGHGRARRAADEGEHGVPARDGEQPTGWWRRPRAGDDPWDTLWREIDRSRRHRHELALVRLAPPIRRRGERRVLTVTAIALRRAIRSMDVLWVAEDSIFMLLPETGREAANGLLRRLGDQVSEIVPDGARVACFPQDALTANALRAAVGSSAPSPTALPVGAAGAAAREHDLEAREVMARREASG